MTPILAFATTLTQLAAWATAAPDHRQTLRFPHDGVLLSVDRGPDVTTAAVMAGNAIVSRSIPLAAGHDRQAIPVH